MPLPIAFAIFAAVVVTGAIATKRFDDRRGVATVEALVAQLSILRRLGL
jgi:hypothetical protein